LHQDVISRDFIRKIHGQTTHSTFLSLKNIPQIFVSRLENLEALGDAGIQAFFPDVTFPLQH